MPKSVTVIEFAMKEVKDILIEQAKAIHKDHAGCSISIEYGVGIVKKESNADDIAAKVSFMKGK